jgi:hypothetical protein
MTLTRRALLTLVALAVLAGGCSRTKEDLLKKAETVKTRGELESRLGRPDDIAKLGPMETWTYKASNGEVKFVIVGDTVTMQAAGPSEKKR